MLNTEFNVTNDIASSHTLPGAFYREPAYLEWAAEAIFAPSWQVIGHASVLEKGPFVYPFILHPDLLNEPLMLSIESDQDMRVLSNVCTHRGNIIVKEAGPRRSLVCGYHGRRFDLKGCFRHMPETKGMENFPSERDNLPSLPLRDWKGFYFTALEPGLIPFDAWIESMEDRIGWMPVETFAYDAERSKSYDVEANWALYCDNYLEGFHIPFVHPELNQNLDYGQYETIPMDWGVLQVGIGNAGDAVFDLPKDSPDYGKSVAAYYYWLFPNVMFNFYPWGLSLNIVQPISSSRTRVEFHTYVWREQLLNEGAGADVDTVELQDEDIVESVQRGIQSRLYKQGRFSPKMETGVHRFHQIIQSLIKQK